MQLMFEGINMLVEELLKLQFFLLLAGVSGIERVGWMCASALAYIGCDCI